MTYEGIHFSLQCDHETRSQARCPYIPTSYFLFTEEDNDTGNVEPRVLAYCKNHMSQFGPVSGTNDAVEFNNVADLLAYIDAMKTHEA